MTPQQKTWLIFSPLVLLLIGIAVVSLDLRSPRRTHYDCNVLATGKKASSYRNNAQLLYTSSGQLIHDVALQCSELGTVILNDFDLFIGRVNSGDKARLTKRQYHLLPPRWSSEMKHMGS